MRAHHPKRWLQLTSVELVLNVSTLRQHYTFYISYFYLRDLLISVYVHQYNKLLIFQDLFFCGVRSVESIIYLDAVTLFKISVNL